MIIRPATVYDSSTLFELKNDLTARFWSGVREEISVVAHDVWFEHALVMPERHAIFIAEENALDKFGYGRLQVVSEVQVSFAVRDGRRGEGTGAKILEALENEARQRKYDMLTAYVHSGNYPSLRAFARQGYHLAELRTDKGVAWQILRKDIKR